MGGSINLRYVVKIVYRTILCLKKCLYEVYNSNICSRYNFLLLRNIHFQLFVLEAKLSRRLR